MNNEIGITVYVDSIEYACGCMLNVDIRCAKIEPITVKLCDTHKHWMADQVKKVIIEKN